MYRPTRLLTLLAGATFVLGAFAATPAAFAAPTGPQQEQTPGITVPPPHPCQVHPWLPACQPDLDLSIDPCVHSAEGCPGDGGDDPGDDETTTTEPEEPTDTPDPTAPSVHDDMPTAGPATAVSASPTFTG